ncbi:MAG: [FeFe] hydrogenase, group A [Anaeroplasmataceae bacterium]
MVKVEGFEHRVLIEDDNMSIMVDDSKCKKCKLCQKTCQNEIGVFGFYDLEKTGNNAICINCGQCVQACPFNAITPKSDIERVKDALKSDKIVVFNTAPAVRVGLGDEFELLKGSFVEGKMVSAIKALGADYVLDVVCGADLTIMEEANELVSRIKEKSNNFPMFTSCCPAWVKMCEMYYPEFISNLSSAKSPIAMQGTIVKTYFAQNMNINPDDIINVVVAPCTAKKTEALREELNCSGAKNPDVDIVITTVELAELIKEAGIDFVNLEDGKFDSLFGTGSSSGLIFGNTGGVMQAALRTAFYFINGRNMTEEDIKMCEPIRGIENLKIATVSLGDVTLRVAAVSQMSEAKKLLEQIKNKEIELDFVEIMACKGGCVNGGGQPKVKRPMQESVRQQRNLNLYAKDNSAQPLRFCHENPNIIKLYDSFLESPGSHKAHELLHTTFKDKSNLLDIKK